MESAVNLNEMSSGLGISGNKVSTTCGFELVQRAKETIRKQSAQIEALAENLDTNFSHAVKLILECKGRVIISGMGKSGLIGKKIAATFASTGTASYFIHPAEAFHGDLGMIQKDDIVLLITNSGETEEVLKLLPSLKCFGNKVLAMTGNMNSTLAKHADVTINVGVERELCPNNLAPTSSTTATLVMGDALAISLINERNFQPRDFALFHPGGSLGRRLLTKVKDVMIKDNLPLVDLDEKMSEVILKMTNGRLGLAIVHNPEGVLQGVITDGDLRRALAAGIDLKNATAQEMMTGSPITISEEAQLSEGESLMRDAHIKHVVALNEHGYISGILEFFQ